MGSAREGVNLRLPGAAIQNEGRSPALAYGDRDGRFPRSNHAGRARLGSPLPCGCGCLRRCGCMVRGNHVNWRPLANTNSGALFECPRRGSPPTYRAAPRCAAPEIMTAFEEALGRLPAGALLVAPVDARRGVFPAALPFDGTDCVVEPRLGASAAGSPVRVRDAFSSTRLQESLPPPSPRFSVPRWAFGCGPVRPPYARRSTASAVG